MDFLDKLRQKPRHVRQQIAVITSTLLSIAILSIWVGSWGVQNSIVSENKPKGISPTKVIAASFMGLKERGESIWDNSIKQVQQLASTINVDNPPEYTIYESSAVNASSSKETPQSIE